MSGVGVVATVATYYEVKNGDYCPIPSGFQESECLFLPVYGHGPFDTNTYKYSNGSNWYYSGDVIIHCPVQGSPAVSGTYPKYAIPLWAGINGRRVTCFGSMTAYGGAEGSMVSGHGYAQGYVRVYVIGAKGS